MDKDLLFDQIKELCQLTSKACYKISKDCDVPFRQVILLFIKTMNHLVDETDAGFKT